jgi:thioredoxin reductase
MYDVAIIGGGPAGLNAALLLGRARRHVLLCDTGKPRNSASRAMHGFLSRDGFAPTELRRIGRAELQKYEGIDTREAAVTRASADESGFAITLDSGENFRARRLLLAFGVEDQLPAVDGLRESWGRGVFPCPYCDGWELRDQPLAALGNGPQAAEFALLLSKWSPNLVLCTNGPAELDAKARTVLTARGIKVKEEPLQRLEGGAGSLSRLLFRDGSLLEPRALFFPRAASPQRTAC